MPFYEYLCKHCGTRFDLARSISDRDAPTSCPSCGRSDVKRELPRVSAAIRGGGGSSCGAAGGSFG